MTAVGHRFALRPLPAEDIAAYVAGKTRQVQRQVRGRVRVHAPAERVVAIMGNWAEGGIESLGPQACLLELGGRTIEDVAFWLGVLDADFEVLDPPELAAAVRRLADRYARAAGSRVRVARLRVMAKVVVDVVLKPEILDPQGQAIVGALRRLGVTGVLDVRQGKHFELEVSDSVDDETLHHLSDTLLANPVIENFTIHR